MLGAAVVTGALSIGLLIGHAYEILPSSLPTELPGPQVAPVSAIERGFQVWAYAQAVEAKAIRDRESLVRREAAAEERASPLDAEPASTVAPASLPGPAGDWEEAFREAYGDVFREAFGEGWRFAWRVASCESVGFRPSVVYGPETGAAGELGLFQLHPRGVLPSFYAAGYTDPFDPLQQIAHVAAYTAQNGFGAWTCAW